MVGALGCKEDLQMKRSLLNIRNHLEHLQTVIDGYQKYGACPAIDHEMKRLSFMNRAILRKHDKAKASGQRHDVR